MAHEILNSKIAEVAAAIQQELQEEEVPVITFYQSGDELIVMDTTDNKGMSSDGVARVSKPLKGNDPGGDKKSGGKGQGEKTTSGADGEDTEVQEPKGFDDEQEGRDDIKLSGENGEGDAEGQGGEGEGQDGDSDDSDNQIKIGTKVRIKSTGLEGIVSGINDDGTFAVSPLPTNVAEDKKEEGGALSPVIPVISAQAELVLNEQEQIQQQAHHEGIEVIGDFPEEELEVISPESKGGKGKGKGKPGKGKGKGKGQGEQGDGEQGQGEGEQGNEGNEGDEGQEGQGQQQGQGQPPEAELDADELRQRVEQIKNTLLKLPTFAFRFFGERIEQDGELFTMKSSLALMERFARSVFSKKNPMPTAEAKQFLNDTAEGYSGLLTYLKLNAIFRDGEYYLDPYQTDSNFEGLFTENKLALIYAYCERVDKILLLDSDYYRFMTLSAFNKPELFGKDYLNVHMDLIFRYFRANILPASNVWTMCFVSSILDYQKVYENCQNGLDLYSVLRTPERMDFIVLESTSLLKNISGYNKYLLSELPESNGYILNCLSGYAMSFYRSALTLRDNYSYKEIVMKNIKFILDLQNQRFRDVLWEVFLSAS